MASANNNTKRRKGLITEEDTATLLKRYSAQTILTLLKEIAQFPDVKIDWNVLVKKTSTGISNAYEYQMLWRHLAYRDTLPETIEQHPLDDDSDLEYELEAYPPVSDEASLEAAACVNVLFAPGVPDETGWGSATVEAPLAINIPSWQDCEMASDNPQQDSSSRGINITVPVSVKKEPQTLPAVTMTTAEGLDGTGANAAGQPARKKRKPWTLEEDNQLIAAVKQLGKSNWANILKANYFKGDRTAAQLSQRWAIIGKRPPAAANSETGGGGPGNQFELKEQQLATNRAVSFALDPQNSTKPRPTTKKAASVVPNPMVQAAAVLAGARIATPSTAESLLKAAQSKTAVHMSTTGKSSVPGLTPSSRPYVHYIHTGSSSASPTTYSTAVPSVQPAPLPPATKGKKTPSVYLGVRVKEEKVQSSDEDRNSSKEVVNHSSKESMIKNSVKEEVEPEGIDMAIEDQTTQNPSSLPNAEAAVSDPMQLDYHHINNEKQNLKNLPGAAN